MGWDGTGNDRAQPHITSLTDPRIHSTHRQAPPRSAKMPPAAVPPSPMLGASTTGGAGSNGHGRGNGSQGGDSGSKPPQAPALKQPFLATKLNNFLHLPYVYDLSWCVCF